MSTFEYRVVALAPPSIGRKGLGGAVQTFEAQINEEARQGWEFLRIETVPTPTKRFLRGTRIDRVEYLLFIRRKDGDRAPAHVPGGEAPPDYGRFLRDKPKQDSDAPRGAGRQSHPTAEPQDERFGLEQALDRMDDPAPLSPASPPRTEPLPPLVLNEPQAGEATAEEPHVHETGDRPSPRIENAVRGARGWFSWDKEADPKGVERTDNKPPLRAIR